MTDFVTDIIYNYVHYKKLNLLRDRIDLLNKGLRQASITSSVPLVALFIWLESYKVRSNGPSSFNKHAPPRLGETNRSRSHKGRLFSFTGLATSAPFDDPSKIRFILKQICRLGR